MSISPAPSATRGDITLQPSYFTSSLYVEPLRQDISHLVDLFVARYNQSAGRPFALFKDVWNELGWCWIHFRVFDGRARQSFINVTERIFLERMAETEAPLTRVVCLFALYTFYSTQPSGSTPALYFVRHIAIPIDLYQSTLTLPSNLTDPPLQPLQRYATYVLTSLLKVPAFHILPHSKVQPYNPSVLPREIFVEEGQEETIIAALAADTASSSKKPPKKKGRPTKREKLKKAKDALVMLEKYMDKNVIVPQADHYSQNCASDAGPLGITHSMAAHPPTATLNKYREHKDRLLDSLTQSSDGQPASGQYALERVNHAVLARLRRIDELAAEQGLEVGGEGGEKTGLMRVERAVQELYQDQDSLGRRGGILGLLEGTGTEPAAGEEDLGTGSPGSRNVGYII